MSPGSPVTESSHYVPAMDSELAVFTGKFGRDVKN